MKKKKRYFVGIIFGILAVIAAVLVANNLGFGSNNIKVTNFEECVAAGNPVMESYPRQCIDNGVTFTEEINEQKKYVSTDTDECSRIRFMCAEGRIPFFDDSGCGCELINLPELFLNRTIEKMGVIPVEGFDPDLYKGVFPGLVDSDFNNAEAIGGKWIFSNTRLNFVKETQEITSADGTLTNEGILTLINNLQRRINVEVNTEEDLDNLIVLISEEGKLKVNYCSNESRETDACAAIYEPVCGWSDPAKIQCIKYPCAQTYSNGCEACKDSNVLYWTDGQCPEQ